MRRVAIRYVFIVFSFCLRANHNPESGEYFPGLAEAIIPKTVLKQNGDVIRSKDSDVGCTDDVNTPSYFLF
jgi:hypothetical protein